jgi:hypothetical protein
MTALGRTSPAEARSAKTKTLRDIDTDKVISRGYGLHLSLDATWNWISNAVAERFECETHEVHCLETDDGELIAINGEPVAYIESEYEPTYQIMQAAE